MRSIHLGSCLSGTQSAGTACGAPQQEWISYGVKGPRARSRQVAVGSLNNGRILGECRSTPGYSPNALPRHTCPDAKSVCDAGPQTQPRHDP
jgi:hypothetical protein